MNQLLKEFKKKNDGNAATETCVKINFKNMFLLLFYPKWRGLTLLLSQDCILLRLIFDRSSRVQFTTNKWWQKRTLTNSETCRATPTATAGPRRRFHLTFFFFFNDSNSLISLFIDVNTLELRWQNSEVPHDPNLWSKPKLTQSEHFCLATCHNNLWSCSTFKRVIKVRKSYEDPSWVTIS